MNISHSKEFWISEKEEILVFYCKKANIVSLTSADIFNFVVFDGCELILWLIILHFSNSFLIFIADTNPKSSHSKKCCIECFGFRFSTFFPGLLCCSFIFLIFKQLWKSFAVQQFICSSRFQMFRHWHMRQPFLMFSEVNKGRLTLWVSQSRSQYDRKLSEKKKKNEEIKLGRTTLPNTASK